MGHTSTSHPLTDRAVQSLLQDVLMPFEAGQDEPGDVLGPYRLVEKLGEGGFGVVWRAEQSQPVHREVAVKMIKLGMDSREVLARFEMERQMLAGMEHPNIASMLDAGMSADGRPYFVMELVRGDPVTLYCQLRHLPLAERLTLFMAICRGVQHAHQKGIIHRDLKPTNLLVAEVDGTAVPKIIDFGIAKAIATRRLSDYSLLTQSGLAVGTPLYMSPEQIAETGQVDTRSDIYALGVLLYEMLTGHPPFASMTQAGKSAVELRRLICEVNPPRPSRQFRENQGAGFSPQEAAIELPADLDWILLRALEKDPARRYPTAAEFGADLQRFLNHQPVLARPPSTAYLASRWIRRNRLGFAAAMVSVAALLGGTVVAGWQAVKARRAQTSAEAQTSRAVLAETRARETAAFLTNLLDDAAEEIDRGRNPEALQRALDHSAGPLQELAYDPELQGTLLQRVAGLYSTMGDWKTALQLLETRTAALARVHGPGSPEALEAELEYLKLVSDQGSRTSAPPRLEALQQKVESLGMRGSRFWFEVQRELVRAWLKLSSGTRALSFSQRALAAADEFRPDEKTLLYVQLSHVTVLEHEQQYEAAEQVLMKCRRMPNGRLQTIVGNRLLYLLKSRGDHARAASVLQERIAFLRTLAPEKRPDLVPQLIWLSEFETAAGQHKNAIRHATEALEIVRTRGTSTEPDANPDPDRADAGACLRNLALAHSGAGHHEEALRLANEARQNALGQGHRAVLMKAITCEARVLQNAGRLEEAFNGYRECHGLREERLANYRSRTTSLEPMWDIRMAQKRWPDAVALITEMWPRPGTDDPTALTDTDHLGHIANLGLETWTAWQKAEPQATPPAELPTWQKASSARAQLDSIR